MRQACLFKKTDIRERGADEHSDTCLVLYSPEPHSAPVSHRYQTQPARVRSRPTALPRSGQCPAGHSFTRAATGQRDSDTIDWNSQLHEIGDKSMVLTGPVSAAWDQETSSACAYLEGRMRSCWNQWLVRPYGTSSHAEVRAGTSWVLTLPHLQKKILLQERNQGTLYCLSSYTRDLRLSTYYRPL